MRRSLILGTLATALAVPTLAHADDAHPLTLRLEPGVAYPMKSPQDSRFGPGFDLTLKPTVGVTPWFDASLVGSVLALPSFLPGIAMGTGYGIGAGVKVKRPHDASNKGTGLSAVSPWEDADVQFERTGPLNRAALSVAVGASVPTSANRNLWVGPFVRYTDIMQANTVGYNSTDAHVFIVGLSFELGCPAKKPVPAPLPPPPPVVIVTPTPPSPEPPPPAPPPDVVPEVHVVHLHDKVQFPFDSAVPLPGSDKALQNLVGLFTARADANVEVDGYASSEGPVDYNQALSVRRAQAVANYLVKNGVPADHLTVKGFGIDNPIAPNDTEAHRAVNRRVEFNIDVTITETDGDVK